MPRSPPGSETPSASSSLRSSSWSAIDPAAADDPKSERPKRAPSSSAQETSRTVSGGSPSSAIRRSTSAPAITFRHPSSQPPFGTESRWPPRISACSLAPGSVHHWFPAASKLSTAARALELGRHPLLRTFPRLRPGHPLGAVLVAGELAQLAQLLDGAGRVQRHAAILTPPSQTCHRPSGVWYGYGDVERRSGPVRSPSLAARRCCRRCATSGSRRSCSSSSVSSGRRTSGSASGSS